jgi:hypothetical protein
MWKSAMCWCQPVPCSGGPPARRGVHAEIPVQEKIPQAIRAPRGVTRFYMRKLVDDGLFEHRKPRRTVNDWTYLHKLPPGARIFCAAP